MCPNKVKGADNVNVTWNYSESAGSAVAAALEAEVSFTKFICKDKYIGKKIFQGDSKLKFVKSIFINL